MVRQTSIDAYNTIKENGFLSRARWLVYDALYKNGPLTRSEVDSVLTMGCYKSHVSARLCELRDMGVVSEIGERQCSVSGQNVILWDVTSKLPIKLKKQKKVKCMFCDGKGYQ